MVDLSDVTEETERLDANNEVFTVIESPSSHIIPDADGFEILSNIED